MSAKKDSKKSSILVNAFSNWISLFLNIIVLFFLTPYIIKYLGKEGYGTWTLILSLIGYYGLLNLGIGSAIVRYVARYLGNNEDESLYETVSTSLITFSITGLIVICLSFIIRQPIADFFKIAESQLYAFKVTVVILGMSTGITFPMSVMQGVLSGFEKYLSINIVNICVTITRTILIIIFIKPLGLQGLAYAHLIGSILTCISFIVLFYKLPFKIVLSFAYVKWKRLKTLLLFGSSTFVISVANILRFNLDSFVIGHWVSLSAVAVYSIANQLVSYLVRIFTTGLSVLTPRFSYLDGKKDNNNIKDLFIITLHLSSWMSFGACTGLLVLGSSFIKVWVGIEFNDASYVLYILAFAYIFALSQNPSIGLLFAVNKHRFFAITTIFEGIVNLGISIALVKKYGIYGVALGTAIPMFIIKLFIQPIYVSKVCDISVYEYYKSMFIPFVLSSIVIAGIIFTNTISYFSSLSIFFIVVFAVLITIVYSVGALISYMKIKKVIKD